MKLGLSNTTYKVPFRTQPGHKSKKILALYSDTDDELTLLASFLEHSVNLKF